MKKLNQIELREAIYKISSHLKSVTDVADALYKAKIDEEGNYVVSGENSISETDMSYFRKFLSNDDISIRTLRARKPKENSKGKTSKKKVSEEKIFKKYEVFRSAQSGPQSFSTLKSDDAIGFLAKKVSEARDRGRRTYAVIHHHSGRMADGLLQRLIACGSVADLFVAAKESGIVLGHSENIQMTIARLKQGENTDGRQTARETDGRAEYDIRCFGFDAPASFRSIIIVHDGRSQSDALAHPYVSRGGPLDVLDYLDELPDDSECHFNLGSYIWHSPTPVQSSEAARPSEKAWELIYGTDGRSPSMMFSGQLSAVRSWVEFTRNIVKANVVGSNSTPFHRSCTQKP